MTAVIAWTAVMLAPWLVLGAIVRVDRWLDQRLDERLAVRAAERLCRAAAGGER